jgi:OmpA-OmpF porin, OOP family
MAVVCLLALTAAANAQTNGMIMSRRGDTMVVSGPEGKTTVLLTENTDTRDNRGLFGLDKEHLGSTVLIPGLKVKVDGPRDDQGRVVAKTITVDGDDLETAEMIEAGLHPTAEQVAANVKTLEAHEVSLGVHKQNIAANQENIAANRQNIAHNKQQIAKTIEDVEAVNNRFTTLHDYDVKGQATVRFAVGSTKISPQDQEALKQLAETAKGVNGYIVEVMGYADSTGSASMNTKLSEDRAKAVITTLVQQGNIPPRFIVAPGAMGEYGAAAPNETKAGRAENRRVEVKILVNKGIVGS